MAALLSRRHLHYTVSLLLSGRPQVLWDLTLFNCETSALEADASTKHAAQLATMPPQLGLTEQQLQEISAGMSLFKDLHNSILEERQVVHAELLAQEISCRGAGSSDGAPGSTYSNSPASTATDDVDCLQHELEERQRNTSRMQVLLHKDIMLRAAAAAWFIGCLDWQQLTKAAVMSWPYLPRILSLAEAVTQYAQQQQQAAGGAAAEHGSAANAGQA
jgi:hypothetical protein